MVINLYFTENVRLARSPENHPRLSQTPKINEAALSGDSNHGVINMSPPNGHARQPDNDMEHVNTEDEDQYAESIAVDSANGQNSKQDHGLDSAAEVVHHHSDLEHAFDLIREDIEDINVARWLHSFGDNDDYEYEIDIDIEKTEYKDMNDMNECISCIT